MRGSILDSIIGLLIIVPLIVMIVFIWSFSSGGVFQGRDAMNELERLSEWVTLGAENPLIVSVESGQRLVITRYEDPDDNIVSLCGDEAAPMEPYCTDDKLCMCMQDDGRTYCVESDLSLYIDSESGYGVGRDCIFLEGPESETISARERVSGGNTYRVLEPGEPPGEE